MKNSGSDIEHAVASDDKTTDSENWSELISKGKKAYIISNIKKYAVLFLVIYMLLSIAERYFVKGDNITLEWFLPTFIGGVIGDILAIVLVFNVIWNKHKNRYTEQDIDIDR